MMIKVKITVALTEQSERDALAAGLRVAADALQAGSSATQQTVAPATASGAPTAPGKADEPKPHTKRGRPVLRKDQPDPFASIDRRG